MAGTHDSSIRARDTNLSRNPNYYKDMGALGGRKGTTGGFYGDSEKAREAGRMGGKASGGNWSSERKMAQSLSMREYWANRRVNA